MAPTRPHSKNAKSKAARRIKKQQQQQQRSSRSPRQLLADATASLEQGDAAAAAAAAAAALEAVEEGGSDASQQQAQLAAAALTLLGEIHLELGDPDSARAFFMRAVETDGGEEGVGGGDDEVEALLLLAGGGGAAAVNRAEKFLWLAQLSEDGGADSVRWYERGAGVLRAQLALLDDKAAREGPTPSSSSAATATATSTTTKAEQSQPGQRRRELLDEARRDVGRRLASALCAVAEVYMTDLSWEADAEQRCEALVTEATLLAPDFPDAWQTVASVRISQGRADDARAALRRSMEPWAAALLVDDDEEEEEKVVAAAAAAAAATKGDKAAPQPPPFPTRVSLVRLLMEVEWEDKAVEVAETLAREDDQSVEALYLGGFGQYVLGEKLKGGSSNNNSNSGEVEEERRAVWRSARRWLKQCLALFEEQDYEDERLGEHARELFATLNKELDLKPDDDDDDDDDDDGWEDDEDGDERME
ncbi:hypothetical protein RB594_005776 [Gaeumannomyces avenae]